MAITPRASTRFLHLLESRFEGALWRLRLIAILPVVMTAISSFATFILGMVAVISTISRKYSAVSWVELICIWSELPY